MPAKLNFNAQFQQKIKFLRVKIHACGQVISFCILKVTEEQVGSGEPGYEIRDPEKTHPGSRGQKSTWIPIRNTAFNGFNNQILGEPGSSVFLCM
jgi:hypothetical protein